MKQLFFLLLLISSLTEAQSQAGSLDPTFAGKGWKTEGFKKGNFFHEYGRSVLPQPDGKYIVVFTVAPGGNEYVMLARYHANGTLDKTYGREGYSEEVLLSNVKAIQQTDGKIVIAGMNYNSNTSADFSLIRYNPDGTLDADFGNNGSVSTDFGYSEDYLASITTQNDGKIVAVGRTYNYGLGWVFAVARYNSEGVLDTEFDGDGIVTTDIGPSEDHASAVAVQSDGKVLVAGLSISPNYDSEIALVRYNANGSLDESFDGDGKVITTLSMSDEYAQAIAIQADNKIVVAGYFSGYATNSTYDFILTRYNPNGSLDTDFNSDGIVTTDFEGRNEFITALAIQGDGKILAAGNGSNSLTNEDFILARYNISGELDDQFGTGGVASTDLGSGNDMVNSIAVEQNGNIILAGYTYSNQGSADFALARYTSNGLLDTQFDSDGKLLGYYPGSSVEVRGIVTQSDGKVVIAGTGYNRGANNDFVVARYNLDGSLDTEFGDNGIVSTDMGSRNVQLFSLALQGDGKIVAVGNDVCTPGVGGIVLVRYNINGSLDESFDGDGKLMPPPRTDGGVMCARRIQENMGIATYPGKIVVSRPISNSSTGWDFAIVRYNENGALDTEFDSDGVVITDLGASEEGVNSIRVQPDGKILAAGYTSGSSTGYDFALVRYNQNGTLDTDFGSNGIVTTDFDNTAQYATSMIQQEDGKIVLAGVSRTCDNTIVSHHSFIARYNSNGSLDETFSNDGKSTVLLGSRPLSEMEVCGYYSFIPEMSLATEKNGNILLSSYMRQKEDDFITVRLTTDGTLDNTFGSNGKAVTDFGSSWDYPYAAAVHNNRLYVVGTSYTFEDRGAIAAYLLNCEKTKFYIDNDGDGYGNSVAAALEACVAPENYVSQGGDCDDDDETVYPGAAEVCDGKDNNCNGTVDEGVKTTFYYDGDGDGYGDINNTTLACAAPTKYVSIAGDCNDNNAAVKPGATETCDGIDNDCNGQIDETCNSKAVLSITSATVYESKGSVQLTVTLSKRVPGGVKVNYATVEGTARTKSTKNNPADFTAQTGTLTFGPEEQVKTISVPILNGGSTANDAVEPTEQFTVQLSKPSGAGISNGIGTVTILDGVAPLTSADVTRSKANPVTSEAAADEFLVQALPNPSRGQFTLQTRSISAQGVQVRVLDNLGRLVESRTSPAGNMTLSFGAGYRPGVYFVEVVQGTERKLLKLVKQ